jgi:transposase
VIAAVEATGATAHIPSQSTVHVVRTVDRALYKERNRVERFFNRLKHFRGTATQYFKTAAIFLAALQAQEMHEFASAAGTVAALIDAYVAA